MTEYAGAQRARQQYDPRVLRNGQGTRGSNVRRPSDMNSTREFDTVSVRQRTNRQTAQPRTRQAKPAQRGAVRVSEIKPSVEMKAPKKRISVGFLAVVILLTFLIVILLQSISNVYQTEKRISSLKNEISDLTYEAEQAQLKLDIKNDIRVIEDLAVNKYGMVKEDSLQRRFISLSEGESIEVMEADAESEEVGGVMFSALFESIAKFFNGDE